MPGDNAGPAVRELDNSTASQTLKEQVDSLPWDAVIEPLARHVFSLPVDALPKPYMVELPEDVDTHMQNASCYDVNKAEVPTTGDHYLAVALEERSVAEDEADFAFIPYYQGCYFNYLHENTYKKLADSVAVAETQIVLSDKMKASNIVVPFTHDWGSVSRPRTAYACLSVPDYPICSAPAGGLYLKTFYPEVPHHRCRKPSRGKSMATTIRDV